MQKKSDCVVYPYGMSRPSNSTVLLGKPRNLMCFGISRSKFVHNVNIFPKISRGQECDYSYMGQGQQPVLSP